MPCQLPECQLYPSCVSLSKINHELAQKEPDTVLIATTKMLATTVSCRQLDDILEKTQKIVETLRPPLVPFRTQDPDSCIFDNCQGAAQCRVRQLVEERYSHENLTKPQLDFTRATIISSGSCKDLVVTLKYIDQIRSRIPTANHLDHDQ
ncbi:hypothetical protein M1116_00995 [Patescibacteria group bacterium]|nr:hypothetical protein [Patescibacteria group bacterium]